jgi:membrane associated rhomboid family serine protease
MPSVYAQDIEVPRMTPAVQWLMGINAAVYFVQATLVGDDNMARLFGYAPGNLSGALWTVLTYMFVHGGLLHLALNLYTLWIFGPRTEAALGTSTFTWFYLWCGLGGWLFHYMFVPSGGVLVGASAAILGVAVAYATKWPDDQMLFFGIVPMNVKWLVLLIAGLNVVNALTSGGGGGTAYWAHVGGIVAAWVYLRSPSAQSLEALRKRIAPAPDYGDDPPRVAPKGNGRRSPSRGEIDEVVAQSKAATAQVRPSAKRVAPVPPSPLVPAALDQVLDKIGAVGIEGLSAEERRVLDEASRKLREQ